jgi:hypothetical protein
MQNYVCTSLCKHELMEILKPAGFQQIRTLKAFGQSFAPTQQDESIVYECRK